MADNKFLDQQGLSTLWSRIGEVYARVRRDNESNYAADFIPIAREACIVDTNNQKLRIKIGDGTTQWRDLPYIDELNDIIITGYYLNGKFYSDSTYQVELEKTENKLYIDKNSKLFYHYDGTQFVSINETLPNATDSVAGIMKLYQKAGQNTDGSMSQKAVTDGVQSIGFTVDENDSECLILDLPWD